jgi:hypothetical protein
MPPSGADRNLLFGILALQMDFVSRDGLIKGMNTWVLDKTRLKRADAETASRKESLGIPSFL